MIAKSEFDEEEASELLPTDEPEMTREKIWSKIRSD
jgi:hypothetical protein